MNHRLIGAALADLLNAYGASVTVQTESGDLAIQPAAVVPPDVMRIVQRHKADVARSIILGELMGAKAEAADLRAQLEEYRVGEGVPDEAS